MAAESVKRATQLSKQIYNIGRRATQLRLSKQKKAKTMRVAQGFKYFINKHMNHNALAQSSTYNC